MATEGPNPPSGPDRLDRPIMDHVALASERAWDNVIRYCYHLGGIWLGGPGGPPTEDATDDAFYFCQIEFEGGTKLELLEPRPGDGSEFLRRFLHRNGPGPHHFTFKVPDIEASMAAARTAGYDIVGESLDDPEWKEAFLHPKQSHGIVIQLAQQGHTAGWDPATPLPPSAQGRPGRIDEVQHLVSDLDGAAHLFTEVLAMDEVERGESPLGSFVRLRSGPWNLVLIRPSRGGPVRWLADRPGRLLALVMSVTHVALVPDLRPRPAGYELPPEDNLGTRLLLKPFDDGP